MTAYAIAHLFDPNPHPQVIEYIERIQATLDPYEGRFLVHGATVEVKEGEWPGTIVIIAFPTVQHARDWYASPAYGEILPFRADNIRGNTIIVEGVGDDYDPQHTADALRALAAQMAQD